MVRNDIECRKGSRKNLNKIALRILRIALVTVLVVGYLPVYFGFKTFVAEMFGDNGYMHVEEITKETYEQIAQADSMFAELPYGSLVKEVYVKYAFDGDAYLSIYVETPQEYVAEFIQWLDEKQKKYNRNENIFDFHYFDSSKAYYFENLTSNETETVSSKIFNVSYAILVVLLLIPYEEFVFKMRNKVESSATY